MSGRDDALDAFEARLGHRFEDRSLLDLALRHRSAAHEQMVGSNERLEFLGDAALSHAVAAMLYERWPEASEGQLTRARSVLVREATLAEVARQLDVAAVLDLGSGLQGERPRPSLLADTLEAVLGAALLDGGWRVLQRLVRKLLGPALAGLDLDALGRSEPKTVLQEHAQRHGWPLPVYREVETRGPAHARVYVYEVALQGRVLGRGEGSSKRAAQQAAALDALAALPDEERTEASG
ncbi:MAG TPA: ribonuclease III [Thermoanaerobaculaceae bacterium]|nr:ribonuclease III [Thermoanaerobaculaceae bacterium]HRS16950.1 ribonuclease III [Thermoanaerobaculaceae bacterium]